MNVQELIDQLQKIEDKSLRILNEGCDCYVPAASVTVVEFGKQDLESFVLIQKVAE